MEVGFSEVMVIALLMIILFGPNKIPSIARDLGAGVRKMKGAVEEIKTEILKETDNPVSEIKREIEKVKESARQYNPMAEVEDAFSVNTQKKGDEEKHNPLDEDYTGSVSRKR